MKSLMNYRTHIFLTMKFLYTARPPDPLVIIFFTVLWNCRRRILPVLLHSQAAGSETRTSWHAPRSGMRSVEAPQRAQTASIRQRMRECSAARVQNERLDYVKVWKGTKSHFGEGGCFSDSLVHLAGLHQYRLLKPLSQNAPSESFLLLLPPSCSLFL